MNFDTAKENIKPLRGGRRADLLETALGDEKERLEQERKAYEESINAYTGVDPLNLWYEYISWIEQSFIKSGTEGNLQDVISKCVQKFESDPRYKQDRRLVKLFIKYIDLQNNPQELYLQLYNNGIGTMVADLYIAWSYYFDAVNDFKQAETIFKKGFDAGAQPFDELTQAHQTFSISMSQRMLYDDESSREQFKISLEERRHALTSLKPQNKKFFVGSIRTGNAIRDENPGKIFLDDRHEPLSSSSAAASFQKGIYVHPDESEVSRLPSNVSSARSIIDSAKKNENVHEPGPWNNAKLKGGKSLFAKSSLAVKPDFAIMEDESFQMQIPYSHKLYENGIKLPKNFIAINKSQKDWNYPSIIEEPIVPNSISCYNKFYTYPSQNVEISPEEVRAFNWFKVRKTKSPLTEKYNNFLNNHYENGLRFFVGFVAKNVPQNTVKFDLTLEDDEGFQFPFKKMISSGVEISIEELLSKKFYTGDIKIVTNEDFEEEIVSDDMEITFIGDRRQSIYPMSRKSFVPRKSIMRRSFLHLSNLDEQDESAHSKSKSSEGDKSENNAVVVENVSSDGTREKTGTKRKLQESDTDEKKDCGKTRKNSDSPVHNRQDLEVFENIFKLPPPPPIAAAVAEKKIVIFEDDAADPNDTCSTQQFNLFIKAQSVSTPIMMKKTVPRLVPLAEQEQSTATSDEQKQHEHTNPEGTQNSISPQYPMSAPKQLSTIMEVTETTHSTKSSESGSVENYCFKFGSNEKDAKDEKDRSINVFDIYRIPEEPTVTVPFLMKSLKLPKIADILHNNTTLKHVEEELPPPLMILNDDQTLVDIPIPELQPSPLKNIEQVLINFSQDDTLKLFQTANKPNYDESLNQEERQIANENAEQVSENALIHETMKKDTLDLEALLPKRTVSDEFLELCAKTPVKQNTIKSHACEEKQLSNVNSNKKLPLESSFKKLSIEQLSSDASPTLKIFEDDLNTERFNLPLASTTNSTMLSVDTMTVVKQRNLLLDTSIELHEGELNRLESKYADEINASKKAEEVKQLPEPVFKIPDIPISKPPAKENKTDGLDQFEIYEDPSEEEDDLSKSIYYNENNKAPKNVAVDDDENIELWEDEKMCSFVVNSYNRYEHTLMPEMNVSIKLRDAITRSNGNPFSDAVRNLVLEQCHFEQYLDDHVESCTLLKTIPKLRIGTGFDCGTEQYQVIKFIAKGSFGSIYTVRSNKNNEIYAAKQEKPANMWEYYICMELIHRLKSNSLDYMFPAFMQVHQAIIANNSSVIVSEYSPFGTIIDVCNKIKNSTGRNVDEYIGMILIAQLLQIIDCLHSCKIIHADLKPDNLLLMTKIELGVKIPALQLIDFGSAIDMYSYDKDDKFTYVVQTDNFTCCEMRENRPWTFQTDLFGICGTAHVLLFGKYMEVEKKIGNWQITTKFPRYFQKQMWDIFFNTLLNVPSDCKTFPNLQGLKQSLEEEIFIRQKYVNDKIMEFNQALIN